MHRIIELASHTREELLDLTDRVRRIVEVSGERDGLVAAEGGMKW